VLMAIWHHVSINQMVVVNTGFSVIVV